MLGAIVRRRRDRGRHDHAGRLVHDELQPGHAGLSASGRTLVTSTSRTSTHPVRHDDSARLSIPRRASRTSRSLVPLLGPGDAAYPCARSRRTTGCPLPTGSLVMLPASLVARPGRRHPDGGRRDGAAAAARRRSPLRRRSPRASCSTRTSVATIESTIGGLQPAPSRRRRRPAGPSRRPNALFTETCGQRLRDRRHPSHARPCHGRSLLLRRRSPDVRSGTAVVADEFIRP